MFSEFFFISIGQVGQPIGEDNCSQNDVTSSSLHKLEGKCSWGKIPTDLLASSLANCPKFLEQDSCLTFCSHKVDAAGSYQVQICISAQEAGARDMSESPYSSYTYDNVPPSSLPDILRLRAGNVVFNYKYYNDTMRKTEVTEDFSCPFCLVRCGSFKGLGFHLNSTHDLFSFEFMITEQYQVVNVSLKADVWRTEPMALEQVFSDRDSEDEVDDDIADFEDRRMLDDFVDVTKDEKQIMHMWNSFVRKQRVLADGHVPWACEAFSRLHGQQLVQNTALLWGWRFFMIKLWNHSLLDGRTMNTCNIILQGFQDGSSGPK
ncbi:hypothetical protein PR202_ga13498 [Eleusine coracana subsp. coracana]|uniref:Polycomb protein VEFS-Box domain-containing protein n=1 Tax=Eleusine coracana subsp. coracana TaxID=191504 RepID=A0AAV5CE61_ELECO|nr:hypothetical protein PR202_ga13498 [Eleusine coracana subsp. coracana]